MKDRPNVVLIGMPGCGKSTVGVVLAKRLGLGFLDTDLLIQAAAGRTLQQIVDAEGHEHLRDAEERAVLSVDAAGAVIATGGSVVYSPTGMAHLRQQGVLVYLEVDLPTLVTRVGDHSDRGLAKRPDQTFEELFEERVALYRQYAEITVDGSGPTTEAVCERIEAASDR